MLYLLIKLIYKLLENQVCLFEAIKTQLIAYLFLCEIDILQKNTLHSKTKKISCLWIIKKGPLFG